MIGRLASLLILVIDVIAIVDIVKSSHTTEKKILWIIAVVLLPVLGPLLYFLLGRK